MVRCIVKGCGVVSRHGGAKCWRQHQMCHAHALEHHPEIYHEWHLRKIKHPYERTKGKGGRYYDHYVS